MQFHTVFLKMTSLASESREGSDEQVSWKNIPDFQLSLFIGTEDDIQQAEKWKNEQSRFYKVDWCKLSVREFPDVILLK